ncbi:MAG: divergent PAP2 family protein [Mycoplasmatales bacterium]
MNDIFMAAFISMVLAQIIKVPIYYLKTGKWEWDMAVSTGSTPSSHSAFTVALTTAVAYQEGFNSTYFAISLVFTMVILHDAVKVRGESGKQAKIINELRKDMNQMIQILSVNVENSEKAEKLKELIGHKTSEVVAGICFGVVVAQIYMVSVS